MRKLPVIRSVGEVFSGVTRHYFELLGVAAFPILATLIVMMLSGFLLWDTDLARWYMTLASQPMAEEPPLPPSDPGAWLLVFVSIILIGLFFAASAVRWHRFVLLGERPGAGGAPLAIWRGEDTRYIVVLLKLSFVMLLAMLPVVFGSMLAGALMSGSESGAVTAVEGLLIFGLFLLLILLFVRISLALPDAAVSGRGAIRGIFERTEGNSWRLVGYNILVQLILMVVSLVYSLILTLIVSAIFADRTGGGAMLATVLLNIPIYLYSSMVGVTMLSVAYREIVGLPGGGAGGTSAADPASAL